MEPSWGESGVTEAFLEKVTRSQVIPRPRGQGMKSLLSPLLSCREPCLQQMPHQYLPLSNNPPLTFH